MCEGVGVPQLLLVHAAECPGDLLEEDIDCSSPFHIVQCTASRVQFTCTRVHVHAHTHTPAFSVHIAGSTHSLIGGMPLSRLPSVPNVPGTVQN